MSPTPGPWQSDNAMVGWDSGRSPAVAVWGPLDEQNMRRPVCMVQRDTTQMDPVYGRGGSLNPLDDARLIAAAPELLAALRIARETIAMACGTTAPFVKQAFAIIDPAIAKAEGAK